MYEVVMRKRETRGVKEEESVARVVIRGDVLRSDLR